MVVAMLNGANAKAARVAPCLVNTDTPPTADQLSEARLVLIGAIRRWSEAGAGALQSESVDDYTRTIDTRQRSSGYNLWPSEIKQLQDICATMDTSSGAFSFSPSCSSTVHQPWCALYFGATYCSCGADIAGYPLYEYADDFAGDTY